MSTLSTLHNKMVITILRVVPAHLGLVVAPQNKNIELYENIDQPQKELHCR